ncbi:uncharacterized protein LOC126567143 [Anopheles maculipalpis]|uniref:uncharacterized protein LOC126567143 n=1 Tax=Anopheles maculipalpis TaxID=1496333 RepID=UPI002158CA41|nr:uncharacterized protein LOC126567143 [Anopheles maculipalpis]
MIEHPESIPLQQATVSVRRIVEQEKDNDREDSSKTNDRTPSIDVHNIAGLITILTVNIHQLESLLQVGPDLGLKFWLNIILVSISIVCVYPLLVLRMLQGEGYKPSPRRYWVSFVLMVIIFTINLTLQIFNDLDAQCTVLLNQALPPTPPSPYTSTNCSV